MILTSRKIGCSFLSSFLSALVWMVDAPAVLVRTQVQRPPRHQAFECPHVLLIIHRFAHMVFNSQLATIGAGHVLAFNGSTRPSRLLLARPHRRPCRVPQDRTEVRHRVCAAGTSNGSVGREARTLMMQWVPHLWISGLRIQEETSCRAHPPLSISADQTVTPRWLVRQG